MPATAANPAVQKPAAEANTHSAHPEDGGPDARREGGDRGLSSGHAEDHGHGDHENAGDFGCHHRPFGQVQDMHRMRIAFFTEYGSCEELRSSCSRRDAGRHEERGQHGRIDERIADQCGNQEPGVGADAECQKENDPGDRASGFIEDVAQFFHQTAQTKRQPLQTVPKHNHREHRSKRDVKKEHHHAHAHDARRVVEDENAPEKERIGQIEHQAEHAEENRCQRDRCGCFEERLVARKPPKLHHRENYAQRAPRDACEEKVHGNRPRPGDAFGETD